MNGYETELRDKWAKINYRAGGSLQLSVEHPLEWFVRYETPELKSIVAVSDKPAVNLSSSKSIDASCRLRQDGKFAISLTLMRRNEEDVFIAMAGDIIQFSKSSSSSEAVKRLVKRYAAWRQLLDHKHSALLSAEAQKGLIGELIFLRERIEDGMSPKDAVLGWVGPENGDQDFLYEDGWHEIKTIGVSASYVLISSLEQIDKDTVGELVVYRVDKCAPAQSKSFTLYNLVHSVLDLLVADAVASDSFMMKLGCIGYIDMKEYDRQDYRYSSKRAYLIDTSFPSIDRKDVPPEIINAQYQISLSSIERWAK